MPSFITPIELTRSFSVKPAAGLRYGNFEGVENLPPVPATSRPGAHSFTELNNQQIVKTICEWSDGWRPWQQKVLLCGIVDRISTRQVDMLATTLEPVRHRDYTTAAIHHYPTTPLKKSRKEWSDKKKKNKKKKRKYLKKEEKEDLVEAYPMVEDSLVADDRLDLTDYMALTPESVISVVPKFCTREGQRELEEKLYLESVKQKEASRKAKWEKLERKRRKAELKKAQLAKAKNMSGEENDADQIDSALYTNMSEFADVLADKIIGDTLSRSLTAVSLSDMYAQDLADTILQEAVTTVVGHVEQQHDNLEKKGILHRHSDSGKVAKSREISFVLDTQYVGEEPSENQVQLDNIVIPSPELPVHADKGIMKAASSSGEPSCKSARPTSLVRIKSPALEDKELGAGEPAMGQTVKRENSGQSGVSRMSALTRASIGNIRYQLFGANSISTPEFFRRKDRNVGPMQRELRQGEVQRPSRLQDLPVPAPRLYKSVRWWPEMPRDGSFFHQASQQELNTNFRDQLQHVWNWLERWEDYERITLLKELLKLCEPENLGFFSSHIQQHLRDARDVNRLPDKLLLYIFSFLSADDIHTISRVSRRWRFLSATDDLWMIKCHELGVMEGIGGLEKMIEMNSRQKMGIDWRQAYQELSQVTRLWNLERRQKDKRTKSKQEKAVDFKEELALLQKKEQVKARAASRGSPSIVELAVHRGTWSAILKKNRVDGDDAQSVVSEDLSGLDDEYRIQWDTEPVAPPPIVEIPPEPVECVEEPVQVTAQSDRKLDRVATLMKPSILHHEPDKGESETEDAAYDIRPDLTPAVDILGKARSHMKLEWHETRRGAGRARGMVNTKEEDAPTHHRGRTPTFVGLVKSVLRARKLEGHMNGITCVQYDRRRLISAGLDRVIRMWDIRSGRSLHKFKGHKGGIRCLQFSGNELLTGSWDTTIMVWDLRNLSRRFSLTDHKDSVSCLELSQDFLVSGSNDCTVRVWRRTSYLCCNVIRGHTAPVTSLAFDGCHVVSASMDKTLRLCNIVTGQCLHVYAGSGEPVLTVTMKGSLILSGDAAGHVYFWNKSTGQPEAAIQAHSAPIHRLAFLDRRFYTAAGDGTIREWDLVTMTSVRLLQGHRGPVRDIKVSSDRIVSCSDDGSIRIWDLFDPRKKTSIQEQIEQLHQE